jgi:hypothetical protein
MRMSVGTAYCSLMLLIVPCSLAGQAVSRHGTSASARKFVEGFYKWYGACAQNLNERTSDAALKLRSSDFGPQLARLLKEDSAAQDKCAEIVGLDFDPILNTQDPDDSYEVGRITQKGDYYRAEIYGVRSGTRRERPDVIAEFQNKNDHWFFVNFYYPSLGTDLLKILKSPWPPCSVPRVPTKK